MAPIPRLAHTQIAAERPLDLRYADRRLLALYFDMTAMPPADQSRSIGAAQDFIRKHMTPADLVAIMVYAGGEVTVHEDFTGDRERLLSTLQTMIVGEDESVPEPVVDGAFGQSGGEFAIFRTDRQLSALQTAAKMLGQLNEKKSLIYFASGLRLNGTDNHAQLRATINAATRAGVSFFTVDARGLVAQAPMGDATRASPGGIGAYSGATAMTAITNLQRTQDTLWSLAADTGGKALLDANDLTLGIVQAQKSIVSYYVLGYYTSNSALDGRQRKVKITLTSDLSAELDYRGSYYAGKEFKKFTTADKERQLEDAFMLGDPITELTMAMEVNYFQLNRAEYFVPIAIKIPGSELALAKHGGAEHTLIDFLGEIRSGGPANNVRDKIDIKLSDSTAAELSTRPITYDTGFTVMPGSYRIKFLARDAETGRIGTYETSVVHSEPESQARCRRIRRSPSAPSSSAASASSSTTPSSTPPRTKRKARCCRASIRWCRKARSSSPASPASSARPSRCTCTCRPTSRAPRLRTRWPPSSPSIAETSKRLRPRPYPSPSASPNRLNTMPIKLSIPIDKLATGEYRLQVTVLDPTAQSAAFWQTSVMLVQ